MTEKTLWDQPPEPEPDPEETDEERAKPILNTENIHCAVPDKVPKPRVGLLYQVYEQVLPHIRGKENAKPMQKIKKLLDPVPHDTTSTGEPIRRVMKWLWNKEGVPVHGHATGFFVCRTEAELNEIQENTQIRIQGLDRNLRAGEKLREALFRNQL